MRLQAGRQVERGTRSPARAAVLVWLVLPLQLLVVNDASADGTSVPVSAFAEAGFAGSTRAATLGVTWDWRWNKDIGRVRITGDWEASASRWSYRGDESGERKTLWQLALIPVFRFQSKNQDSPFFFEAGVGVTCMDVPYDTGRKRFSTRFNFGDQMGVGFAFGPLRQHEISLRMEHFSNAGIRHPNPGENFLQLRYLYRPDQRDRS